ncbi:hypothetical protein [Actinoplanes sp. G11-F43]|uniref:hypothetical protein n=1 Tax=Actinoplanes sp. G11-F43 TaxID=3424130 RepID=UPI003D35713F
MNRHGWTALAAAAGLLGATATGWAVWPDRIDDHARDLLYQHAAPSGSADRFWDDGFSPGLISIESAVVTDGGRTLTATFTGAPEPASKPCGADYTGRAFESTTAVVVEVRATTADQADCEDLGGTRTVTVELASPLGQRAVLETRQGLPVPVTVE